jgi:hypothetical protein
MMTRGARVPFGPTFKIQGEKKKTIYEKGCPGQLHAWLRLHAVVLDRIGYLFNVKNTQKQVKLTINSWLQFNPQDLRPSWTPDGLSAELHLSQEPKSVCITEPSTWPRTNIFGPTRNGPLQRPTDSDYWVWCQSKVF